MPFIALLITSPCPRFYAQSYHFAEKCHTTVDTSLFFCKKTFVFLIHEKQFLTFAMRDCQVQVTTRDESAA